MMSSSEQPLRSYYEAYARKSAASGRRSDAVFVERGALTAAAGTPGFGGGGSGRSGVALLPTEQRMVDRDAYVGFLEEQLRRVSEMVVGLDAKSAEVDARVAAAEARCGAAATIAGAGACGGDFLTFCSMG